MSFLAYAGFAALAGALYGFLIYQHYEKPLLPGPKPRFILGNALDIPTDQSWETFTEWKDKYGDVVFLRALGRTLVVLNSREACVDLLDKRSLIYSDRPQFVMSMELMQWTWPFAPMRYSPRWRAHRRVFSQIFDEHHSRGYTPLQEEHIHNFLRGLLNHPQKFWSSVRSSFADVMLDTVYHIRGDKKIIELLEEGVRAVNLTAIPGRYLVDIFPILKYVPSWVPGAGFQKEAIAVRGLAQDVKEVPARIVEESMKKGTAEHSILRIMLSNCEEGTLNLGGFTGEAPEEIAKNVAAQAYFAGADSTSIVTHGFFLAMANYPEVQRAARSEIDNVTRSLRLPGADDINELPYIQAIVKEVLRWHCPLPFSIPHASTEDDEYKGYQIPKGATIIPNAWAILHDEEVYPDAYSFRPGRWLMETEKGVALNPNIPDPDATFGFGRRVCPGRYFAQNQLFLTFSKILAGFEITPLDQNGNPTERIDKSIDGAGFLNIIKPFNLSVRPRSAQMARIIAETE